MSESNYSFGAIKQFPEFLEKCLKRSVLEYSIKPLTKPGDNYGSIMQSVCVKVKNLNGSEEVLEMATKTTITNPYLVEIFQPSVTFVKEVHFYADIIPTIQHFEQIKNLPEAERIDAFIRCYGSRISLNPDAKLADADAIILLENIKVLNYANIDGFVGFNMNETLSIVKSMAKIHSLCIAVRRLNPNLFDSGIRPFLDAVNLIPESDGNRQIETISKEINFVDGLDPNLIAKLNEQLKVSFDFTIDTKCAADTPYTTVVHRDLWTNNIMIRRDGIADDAIKAKFYDFQLYFYQSFAHDLIFFLLTSVHSDDLGKHFKSFVNHYHSEFVKILNFVNCPTDVYTFEKMWCEIQKTAELELIHILVMCKLPLVDKTAAPTLDEITPDTFYRKGPPSELVLERFKLIFKLYTENGFI